MRSMIIFLAFVYIDTHRNHGDPGAYDSFARSQKSRARCTVTLVVAYLRCPVH